MNYPLELLAPARNLEQGCAAIDHGADALYVGAHAFGARTAATNSLADVEALTRYAHRYDAKVFVTMNTLLLDDELEPARRMVCALYEMGVDALIVQDMGLMECDLPPIALHASTQAHNATVERVRFMEAAGFRRVILARETSLETMRRMRKACEVELEAFVQGALCVCYSGQCYLSEYLGGIERSGNRGSCAQPCRSAYDLTDGEGHTLLARQHLLSLKDFNASRHLEAMIEAGITSFKIEGRLKDMTYVKNVTAYYRSLLDDYLEGHPQRRKASSGRCRFFFTPDLERTFNRGFTDYFLQARQPMANFASPKARGKQVGKVREVGRDWLTVDGTEGFAPGDGLCFLLDGEMQGFLVNRAEGNRLYPNRMPRITPGTTLWRNNDHAFERQLQGRSAERTIDIDMTFDETAEGFALTLTDAEGHSATATLRTEKTMATNPDRARLTTRQQLSRLGDTPFALRSFHDATPQARFLTTALLNALRREALNALEAAREKARREAAEKERMACETVRRPSDAEGVKVPERLDYSYNVANGMAARLYRRFGAKEIEPALEVSRQYEGKALMTTKYCLRYELGQCLRLKNNDHVDEPFRGDLLLRNNGNTFLLRFDCAECRMRLLPYGTGKKSKK